MIEINGFAVTSAASAGGKAVADLKPQRSASAVVHCSDRASSLLPDFAGRLNSLVTAHAIQDRRLPMADPYAVSEPRREARSERTDDGGAPQPATVGVGQPTGVAVGQHEPGEYDVQGHSVVAGVRERPDRVRGVGWPPEV